MKKKNYLKGMVLSLALLGLATCSGAKNVNAASKSVYVNLETLEYSTNQKNYESIKEYLFSRDEDDHTSLLIGVDAVKKKSSRWRALGASSVFMNETTGICEQAVFYAIPKAERFKKIFEEQLHKKG